jgi:hypothetical protein
MNFQNIPELPEGTYLDNIIHGLSLRVGKNRRTWSYRYRNPAGQHRITIGHYPAIGIAEARERATAVSAKLGRLTFESRLEGIGK